ncbi:MAG: AsmA-like C-terminal region-containing protein, partial [Ferruginibacter sp.]|nr:AsmA-like C-terminal region-containing protein [Ferruginibacter sp.]
IILAVALIAYMGAYIYVTRNKAEILKQVTTEIGDKIDGNVAIGDMDLNFFRQFPKISVVLNNVQITDSLYKQHLHPFFGAKKVFARLSIWKLIRKQAPLNGLRVDNGQIYMYTDSLGYTNAYLFKQKKKAAAQPASSSERNELKSVILNNLGIIIDDRSKLKLHNYFINDLDMKLDDKDDVSFEFDTKANIVIHSMAFNQEKGTFFKETPFKGKFEMRYDKKLNQLQFDSIDIELAGQPFNLSGRFDLKGTKPQFSLRGHTRDLDFKKGKSLLPERIVKSLSIIDIDKSIDVDVALDGPLKGGEPLINIQWAVNKAQLKTPFLDFENASFKGYFNNQFNKDSARLDPNSVIQVSNFTADWRGLPLVAKSIQILDLIEPILTCDLQSNFPLTKLNDVIGSNFVQLQSGDGLINLTYKGPIIRNNNTNSLINGNVSFKNGNLLYAPRNVAMKSLNGEMVFKNSDVFVENLRCVVLDHKILMQGQAKNLLTLINTEPGKARIDWNISTPALNLGAFNFLLKPGQKVKVAANNENTLASAAANIDEVLEKAVLHVKLNAAGLRYQKFSATDLNADVTLLANRYVLNDVSMAHAGGRMNMNGSIQNLKPNYLQAAIKAAVTNVDVKNLLLAFDNFGQTAIASENLDGKLTAKVNASMGLDESGKVYPATIESVVDFSLKDGVLTNYEPIKKLQNILFKNRDFENIRFAELTNRLEINNRDIKINRMEIQSSVFSFFLEGLYSLKGNTDLSIQVPLSNLKKREADYNPENIGTDKKGGRSIFIRGRTGDDGNVAFKLDLFNKYKKDKQEVDSLGN